MNPGAGHLTERYKKAKSCEFELYGDSAAHCYNCVTSYRFQSQQGTLNLFTGCSFVFAICIETEIIPLQSVSMRKKTMLPSTIDWPICVQNKCPV